MDATPCSAIHLGVETVGLKQRVDLKTAHRPAAHAVPQDRRNNIPRLSLRLNLIQRQPTAPGRHSDVDQGF
ncbi:hypothetical protein, partial [Mycobacterium avium]